MGKVCFIGHRTVLSCQKAEKKLTVAIQREIDRGCRQFTMGDHGEFDRLALSVCRKFKKEYEDVEIEVVITGLRKIDDKTLYTDVKTTMYPVEQEYFKRRITSSNRQMIDSCETLICLVDESRNRSGAKTAMRYAEKKGIKIINLFREEDEPTFGMTKEEKMQYYKALFQ